MKGVFFTGLSLMFIGLKLAKVIEWSWWWVLSPVWISLVFTLAALLLVWVVSRDGSR